MIKSRFVRIKIFTRCLLASLCILISPQIGLSYFSTLDTSEPLPVGTSTASLEPQLVLDRTQMMFTGRFDIGLTESTGVRAILGSGAYAPLEWGLMYKWSPIPDIENQPGIAILGGFLLSRLDEKNTVNLRIHPIVSKKFQVSFGEIIPYGALPFGISSRESDTKVPVQLAFGAHFKPETWNRFSVMTEAGVNISNAFGYISANLQYLFGADGE